MRIALIAAVLAAGTALATPALAQDGDAPFTGPRAEAIVGWDRVTDGSDGSQIGTDGVVYGGAVGYDFQAGSAVIGFEGEVTGATTRDRDNGLIVANDSFRVGAGRDLYAGARIGFVVGNNALIYAKGGYTNARITTRYESGTTRIEDNADLDGFRLGAGAELSLGGNLYVKGEYRYSNYNEFEGQDINLDRHQVVGGVGLRF